jgi:hypothetical protein
LLPYYPELEKIHASGQGVTLPFITSVVQSIEPGYPITAIQKNWTTWGIQQEFDENEPLDRRTLSILTDKVLNPFAMEVNFQGNLVKVD